MSFDKEIATHFVDPSKPLPPGIPSAPPAGTRRFLLPKITEDWVIRNAPNGGYLLCVILDAVKRDLQMGDPEKPLEYAQVLPESQHRLPDPLYCSASYLNVSLLGKPAYVEVKRLRVGGRATVDAALWQDQPTAAKPNEPHPVLVIKAIVTFGDLTKEKGPTHTTDGEMPRIKPLEECLNTPSLSNPGKYGKPDNEIKARKSGHCWTISWALKLDVDSQVIVLSLSIVIDYLEVYSDPRTMSESWQRTERLDWARFRDREQKVTSLNLGFWADSFLPAPVSLGYKPGEYWLVSFPLLLPLVQLSFRSDPLHPR